MQKSYKYNSHYEQSEEIKKLFSEGKFLLEPSPYQGEGRVRVVIKFYTLTRILDF